MINHLLKIFQKGQFVLYVQILEKVFFFALLLVLARGYSVREYGDIVLIFSVSNILLYVLQFGLPVVFQRQTAKDNRVNKSSLMSAIVYGLSSYVLSTFLLLLIVSQLYNNHQYLLIIIMHSFVFSYFFISVFNSFLLGKGEQRIQFYSYLIARGISIVVILGLLFFLTDVMFFMSVCLAGNISIVLLLYYYLFSRHTEKSEKSQVSFVSLKYLLVMSLPVGIAAMSNFLYDKIDIIIISKILDIEKAAYYNVAYGIFKASQLLFSFLLVTGFSRVSLLSKRKYAVKLFLKKYSVYVLLISTAIAVIILLFSKSILLFIYGDKYMSSVLILQLLSFAVIPLALNNLTGITLNGLGMFRENMIVVLSALLINVVFNVILLNSFGIIGAVYSTLITEMFILVFDLYYLKKKLW